MAQSTARRQTVWVAWEDLSSTYDHVGAFEHEGLIVTLAERRPPYETESQTFRLYVEGARQSG
jgi:hypothetical protein